MHEKHMRQAIAAAKAAQHEGGVAIGAVLVRESDGSVVATGGSLVKPRHDPTAHAEVNCIRSAAAVLDTNDLYDYTLYSTLEPCHMCLSAAAWAKIPRIYYGARRKDVDQTLFDINDASLSDEAEAKRMNLRESIHMTAVGGVLEQECAQLLAGYHSLSSHSNAAEPLQA